MLYLENENFRNISETYRLTCFHQNSYCHTHTIVIFILATVHFLKKLSFHNTVEPLLRGHPDKRPTPLERPLGNVI